MEEQDQIMEPINEDPNFSFCSKKILGEGDSNVYLGRFNGQIVAVKRIDLSKVNTEPLSREVTILLELFPQHEHIVKYLHTADDMAFRYIAFERCDENLHEYVLHPLELNNEAQINILLQLTDALKYIHSRNIIHRDIKPTNVLVFNRNSSSVNMKWADFGHSKRLNEDGFASMSGPRGTKAWLAPEIIPQFYGSKELEAPSSRASDIFSAGCVFFFFLTNGVHPFGDEQNIIGNTMENKNILDDGHPAKSTVIKMMKNERKNRLGLDRVIEELNNP